MIFSLWNQRGVSNGLAGDEKSYRNGGLGRLMGYFFYLFIFFEDLTSYFLFRSFSSNLMCHKKTTGRWCTFRLVRLVMDTEGVGVLDGISSKKDRTPCR